MHARGVAAIRKIHGKLIDLATERERVCGAWSERVAVVRGNDGVCERVVAAHVCFENRCGDARERSVRGRKRGWSGAPAV